MPRQSGKGKASLGFSQTWPRGFRLERTHLTALEQEQWAEQVRNGLALAPLYRPSMRNGRPLSLRMSNFGSLGWVSDRHGYRYLERHPITDKPWPEIPQAFLALWYKITGCDYEPEACLINWYEPGARLGLHVDADEEASTAPVLSVSLGAPALFRLGGTERTSPTQSTWLHSGDIVLLADEARRRYHGIDRIRPLRIPPLTQAGRINLTFRRVTSRRVGPRFLKTQL